MLTWTFCIVNIANRIVKTEQNSQTHLSHLSLANLRHKELKIMFEAQPSTELQGQTGWRANPPYPLELSLSNCLPKLPCLQPHLLPSSRVATAACPRVNIDLLGHSSPPVHGQAESPAQLWAASQPPSKGELCWIKCAGENASTLSVRKLKGAWLPERIKENVRYQERRAAHIESILHWSQWFSMDFPFKGKILPSQKGIRKHHWYVMDYTPEETGLSPSWETH